MDWIFRLHLLQINISLKRFHVLHRCHPQELPLVPIPDLQRFPLTLLLRFLLQMQALSLWIPDRTCWLLPCHCRISWNLLQRRLQRYRHRSQRHHLWCHISHLHWLLLRGQLRKNILLQYRLECPEVFRPGIRSQCRTLCIPAHGVHLMWYLFRLPLRFWSQRPSPWWYRSLPAQRLSLIWRMGYRIPAYRRHAHSSQK